MKNISKIILGAAALLSFAACQNKAEFKTYPYARLISYAYTAVENEGPIKIPVTINKLGATSVTFEVEDLTAVSGADYAITPADGVLTFSTDTVEYITVTPVDKSGTFTGDKDFYICLKSATNGYTIGSYYDCTITVKDTDDPRGDFLGSFGCDVVDYWGYDDAFNITIIPDPDDDTFNDVIVTNLFDYLAGYGYTYTNLLANGYDWSKGLNSVKASMSADRTKLVSNGANGQRIGYSDLEIVSFNAPSPDDADDYAEIEFILQPNGDLVIPNALGGVGDTAGWWFLFVGPTTLNKQ